AGRRTQRRRRVRQAQATRRQERVAYLFDATPSAIEAIAAATCDKGEEKAADDRYVFCELHRLGAALGALQHPEPVRDQRRNDNENDHQHCGVARRQPKHDGKTADEFHAGTDRRQHWGDGSRYAVPRQTGGERVVMMRIAAVLIFTALLAACSGSDRIEGIVPGWANTPSHAPVQYTSRRSQSDGGAARAAETPVKPAAEPQSEAKKPIQNSAEE